MIKINTHVKRDVWDFDLPEPQYRTRPNTKKNGMTVNYEKKHIIQNNAKKTFDLDCRIQTIQSELNRLKLLDGVKK